MRVALGSRARKINTFEYTPPIERPTSNATCDTGVFGLLETGPPYVSEYAHSTASNLIALPVPARSAPERAYARRVTRRNSEIGGILHQLWKVEQNRIALEPCSFQHFPATSHLHKTQQGAGQLCRSFFIGRTTELSSRRVFQTHFHRSSNNSLGDDARNGAVASLISPKIHTVAAGDLRCVSSSHARTPGLGEMRETHRCHIHRGRSGRSRFASAVPEQIKATSGPTTVKLARQVW